MVTTDRATLHLVYAVGLFLLLGATVALYRCSTGDDRARTWAEATLVAASYPLVALADFLTLPGPAAFALVMAGMVAVLVGSYRLRKRVVAAIATPAGGGR